MHFKIFSRFTAIVLSVCLVMSTFQVSVFAEDDSTNEPKLISLTVTNSEGEAIPLIDTKTSIYLGDTYSFEALFSNPDNIDKVYITSTIRGETKIIEAKWNGSSFVSDEVFDEDPAYIPGRIEVKYTKKVVPVEVSEDVDWQPMQSVLEDQVTAEVQTASEESIKASVDISKLISDEVDAAVDIAVDVFDTANGTNLDDFLGQYKELDKMTKYVVGDGNYSIYFDYSDSSAYAAIVKDASGNKWIKMILNSSNSEKLNEVADKLGNVNKISSLAYNYLSVSEGADKLREEVGNRSNISDNEREELNKKIDDYEKDRQMFNLTMAVIPAVVAASGGTMAGPALVFSAILGVLNAASGTFWDYRIGMITGGETSSDVTFANDAHGIKLTHYDLDVNNKTITQSGVYYLPFSHETFNIGTPEGGGSLDVTLCLHGESCEIINNGASLHITSCVPGKSDDYYGGAFAQGHVDIYNNGGNITIEDGHFKIKSSEDGDITINGGIGELGSTKKYTGQEELGDKNIINNGNIYVHAGYIVNHFSSKNCTINIDGGFVGTEIFAEDGIVNISDTSVEKIDGKNCNFSIDGSDIETIKNENGTLDIENSNIIGYNLDKRSIININGEANIYNGTIKGNISNSKEGVITVFGTNINGNIDNSGRKFEIFNANVTGDIDNEARIYKGSNNYEYGEFIIHDGTFNGTVWNRGGEMIINNGTFRASEDEVEVNIVSRAGRQINNTVLNTTINGGTFYSHDRNITNSDSSTADTYITSHMTINNGKFYTSGDKNVANAGKLVINNGYFEQKRSDKESALYYDSNVYNTEDVLINGGKFSATEGNCIWNKAGNAVITNGKFTSADSFGISGNCTLLINKNSLIEVEGERHAFYPPIFSSGGDYYGYYYTIKADTGYTGGVNYKDIYSRDKESELDIEKTMSLAEAEALINSTNRHRTFYVRIMADKFVPGGSDKPITSDEFEITFDPNGGTIAEDDEFELTVNGKLTYLPTAEKSGYVLKGWYTKPTGGEKITTNTIFDEDTTVYAIWSVKSNSGSSGGGGGSSSTKYTATAPVSANGKVALDKTNITKGSLVTVTPKADDGYVLDTIKVVDKNGNEISLTDNGNGTYTFIMPASEVEIKTEFKKVDDAINQSGNSNEKKKIVKMQINSNRFFIDNVAYEKDVAPVIVNDRTLVPIRFVTESLGGKVAWNEKEKEVVLTIDGKEIKMTIGKVLEKYGVAPVILNDRTYMPVRFVADELGATTTWDAVSKMVTVTKIEK